MKIYIVQSCYYDFCNFWYSNVEVFTGETEANLYALHLEEKETDEQTSYMVVQFDVKTFDGALLKDKE